MTAWQSILVILQISPPAWRQHKPLGGQVTSPSMHVPTSTVGNATREGTTQQPCSCPEQNKKESRVFVQSRAKQAQEAWEDSPFRPIHCSFPSLPIFP